MADSVQPAVNRKRRPRRDLGAMRTVMAADRTLMAWIRTALSLYSFGFAIYKILQELEQTGKPLPQESSPRNIGVFLAITGTTAMAMGTIEYWQTIHELRRDTDFWYLRPALVMSLLMSIFGVVLIFGIMTKLF